MRTVCHTASLLLLAATASVTTQTPTDFSGTWSLSPDAPLGANGKPAPAPGYGAQINIRQETGSVTIARILGGQTVHVMHPLDGSESRSRTPGRLCEGDTYSVWTATRQADSIQTTLTGSLPAGAAAPVKMNVRTAFRLTAPDALVVDVTFQNAGMAEPQTRSASYRKTGPPAEVPPAVAPPLQATLSQLDWLGGTWIGTGGTSTFEERWTPAGGGSMLAVARSLRNEVMSSFEFLCIVERNGGLVYQAMPNGRQPATDFALTKLEGQSARFENPAHDFPKVVAYTLQPDGTLEAVISGAATQKPQTFRMKRQ